MGGSWWASNPSRPCHSLVGHWSRLCFSLSTTEGVQEAGNITSPLLPISTVPLTREAEYRVRVTRGAREGGGEKLFLVICLQILQPLPPHLYGLETCLNCSISPQRAVNHTLSNAERWLQAPSAFIINH